MISLRNIRPRESGSPFALDPSGKAWCEENREIPISICSRSCMWRHVSCILADRTKPCWALLAERAHRTTGVGHSRCSKPLNETKGCPHPSTGIEVSSLPNRNSQERAYASISLVFHGISWICVNVWKRIISQKDRRSDPRLSTTRIRNPLIEKKTICSIAATMLCGG